jgi:hypothetical protein
MTDPDPARYGWPSLPDLPAEIGRLRALVLALADNVTTPLITKKLAPLRAAVEADATAAAKRLADTTGQT